MSGNFFILLRPFSLEYQQGTSRVHHTIIHLSVGDDHLLHIHEATCPRQFARIALVSTRKTPNNCKPVHVTVRIMLSRNNTNQYNLVSSTTKRPISDSGPHYLAGVSTDTMPNRNGVDLVEVPVAREFTAFIRGVMRPSAFSIESKLGRICLCLGSCTDIFGTCGRPINFGRLELEWPRQRHRGHHYPP